MARENQRPATNIACECALATCGAQFLLAASLQSVLETTNLKLVGLFPMHCEARSYPICSRAPYMFTIMVTTGKLCWNSR